MAYLYQHLQSNRMIRFLRWLMSTPNRMTEGSFKETISNRQTPYIQNVHVLWRRYRLLIRNMFQYGTKKGVYDININKLTKKFAKCHIL